LEAKIAEIGQDDNPRLSAARFKFRAIGVMDKQALRSSDPSGWTIGAITRRSLPRSRVEKKSRKNSWQIA